MGLDKQHADRNLHTQKFPPSKEIVRFRQMFPDMTSRWSHCQKDRDRQKQQRYRREDMLRGWS